MAQASAGRIRVSGVILLIAAAALAGIGVWLTYIALNWNFPAWVPPAITMAPHGPAMPVVRLQDTPIGLAAAYLVLFAGVAGLNGLWNLLFGRRNWLLVVVMLLLFVIFIAVGGWATVDPDGFGRALARMPATLGG